MSAQLRGGFGRDARVLLSDLSWRPARSLSVGDELLTFDETNGPPKGPGLRAPTSYRRLSRATVTSIRRVRRPAYALTFNDGTMAIGASDQIWLAGSHRTGGRGWRWTSSKGATCNRAEQRSWLLKVAEVVEQEQSWEAGWLGGLYDGEGHLTAGPGLRIVLSQNEGPVFDRAEAFLEKRGFATVRVGSRRCRQLHVNGGMLSALALMMRFRPGRLIAALPPRLHLVSLYGRSHRVSGLIQKVDLGEQELIAVGTDTRTLIVEGLAAHAAFEVAS